VIKYLERTAKKETGKVAKAFLSMLYIFVLMKPCYAGFFFYEIQGGSHERIV